MEEQWRPIEGFDGYEVSDLGRVRNAKTGTVRVLADNRYGYLRVNVRGRSLKVHKIVAEAFVGPCPNGLQVAHKNGKSHDNRAANLMYATREANGMHRFYHGTRRCPVETALESQLRRRVRSKRRVVRHIERQRQQLARNRGESNAAAKLNEQDVRIIHQLRALRVPQKHCAYLFGVSDMQVSRIDRGTRWRHLKPIRLGAAER